MVTSCARARLERLYSQVKKIESTKKRLESDIAVQKVLGNEGGASDGAAPPPPSSSAAAREPPSQPLRPSLKNSPAKRPRLAVDAARGGQSGKVGARFDESVVVASEFFGSPTTTTVDGNGNGNGNDFEDNYGESDYADDQMEIDNDVDENRFRKAAHDSAAAPPPQHSDAAAAAAPPPKPPTKRPSTTTSAAAIPKKKAVKRPPPPKPASSPPSAQAQPRPPMLPDCEGKMVLSEDWDSIKAKEPFILALPDYSPDGILEATSSNTLSVEFSVPEYSNRFCLDIAADVNNCGEKDKDKIFNNILLHVNPRQYWKDGVLLMNDCQGRGNWGIASRPPLDMFPRLFGVKRGLLVIQVRHEGFDLFLKAGDDIGDSDSLSRMVPGTSLMHCFRFEHRSPLPDKAGNFYLRFLTNADDRVAEAQNWVVHRVHWGKHNLYASVTPSKSVPGSTIGRVPHPFKLFVHNLNKGRDSSKGYVERERANLERAFAKYGDATTGVIVKMRAGGNYALVQLKDKEQTDKALSEMKERYPNVSRASMTPAEVAEQKKREAEEAAKEAEKKMLSSW